MLAYCLRGWPNIGHTCTLGRCVVFAGYYISYELIVQTVSTAWQVMLRSILIPSSGQVDRAGSCF